MIKEGLNLNGLRTQRPDLSNYTFCNASTFQLTKTWVDSRLENTNMATRNLLIVGESGLGKTTLAKALCTFIDADKEIIEINCGTNGTLTDAREVIERLDYLPYKGSYRVLLLDEVHRLNENAQNAFLTPLENLAPTSIVIACTSNPEKLIKPFISRFFKIQLTPYSEEAIRHIVDKLNLPISEELKQAAVKGSNGSPRQALDIIERLGSATPEIVQHHLQLEQIKEQLAENMLRSLMVEPAKAFTLMQYLTNENKTLVFNKMLKLIEDLHKQLIGIPTINSNKTEEDCLRFLVSSTVSKNQLSQYAIYWYGIIANGLDKDVAVFKTEILKSINKGIN